MCTYGQSKNVWRFFLKLISKFFDVVSKLTSPEYICCAYKHTLTASKCDTICHSHLKFWRLSQFHVEIYLRKTFGSDEVSLVVDSLDSLHEWRMKAYHFVENVLINAAVMNDGWTVAVTFRKKTQPEVVEIQFWIRNWCRLNRKLLQFSGSGVFQLWVRVIQESQE